jgi:hypothetical protein
LYSDQNIVRQLKQEDLRPIFARQVAIIQKKIGFVQQMSVYEQARANQQLVQLVQEELNTRIIESYGRSLLKKWFRQKGVLTTRFACTTF